MMSKTDDSLLRPKTPPVIPQKTPAEIRQEISDKMRELDLREAQVRNRLFIEIESIQREREMLEYGWRKTYEND